MAKKPAVKNTCSIVMLSGSITINGKTHDLRGVDYNRTETVDGKVIETGRPPGLPAEASVSDVIAHAFQLLHSNEGAQDGKAKSVGRRKRGSSNRKPGPQQ